MIYVAVGVFATVCMFFYHRKPASGSPLWSVSAESLALRRRRDDHGGLISAGIVLTSSFLALFLVSALRVGVGTDYFARYVPLFNEVASGYPVDTEPGFLILNRIATAFGGDSQNIFVLTALLTTVLYFRFILRMSVNLPLSMFIYVFGGTYLSDLNLVQQGLAAAILMNTIELMIRRRYVLCVLATLIAGSIHSTAFVWFAVLPIIIVTQRRWLRLVLTGFGVALVVWAPNILVDITRSTAPDYAWYFTSNYSSIRSVAPFAVAVPLAAFVLVAVKVGLSRHQERYFEAIFSIMAVGVLSLLATLMIAYLFVRVTYYFSPLEIIAVPFAVSLIRNTILRRIISALLIVLYALSFIFQFLVWNAHGVLPYASIFD